MYIIKNIVIKFTIKPITGFIWANLFENPICKNIKTITNGACFILIPISIYQYIIVPINTHTHVKELFVPNICENTPTNNVIKTNFNKLENILLRVIFCIKYLLSRKNYG